MRLAHSAKVLPNLDFVERALAEQRREHFPRGIEEPRRIDDEELLQQFRIVRFVEHHQRLGQLNRRRSHVSPAQTIEQQTLCDKKAKQKKISEAKQTKQTNKKITKTKTKTKDTQPNLR